MVAAKYVIMPCHETGDGTPKAWAVLDQKQMIRQMKVGSVWGLAFVWANVGARTSSARESCDAGSSL